MRTVLVALAAMTLMSAMAARANDTGVSATPEKPDNKLKSIDLRDPRFPSIGDTSARVAIVEFSDFECGYCRQHQADVFPALMGSYVASGKLRYFFLDFPLEFHARAEGAAIAAACAQQGGAFWKMRPYLFERQQELGPKLYSKIASEIGLDVATFEACRKDSKVKRGVRQTIALGEKAGVQGTPAFLIGKFQDGVLTHAQLVWGARPIEDFQKIIDRQLSEASATLSSD